MLWRTDRPRPLPLDFISPCLPTAAKRPPEGPGWIHEVKYDGYRLVARKRDGRVRLFTRRATDWTHRFPWIREAVASLAAQRSSRFRNGHPPFGVRREALSKGRSSLRAVAPFFN